MDNKKEKRDRILLYGFSVAATLCMLAMLLLHNSAPVGQKGSKHTNLALGDRYAMQMKNVASDALEDVLSIRKEYWLSDDDPIAPEPNPACYGAVEDPTELQWLLDAAADVLDGQETYFSPQTQVIPGTTVNYYLDPTIFAVTWKEKINGMTYTLSEVKIAHASQFRRFLAGGEYGSSVQMTPSEMAGVVNAVVASAGDFYKFRRVGVIVYDGKVRRSDAQKVDTCFVDENGDLILSQAGELTSEDAAEQFVEENGIRFSLAFGPILIADGVRCEPSRYPLGEIQKAYSRSGIGQRGELHYILTTVNSELFHRVPNIEQFAAGVEQLGCDNFYALDGGQTATLVMNNRVINDVDYGSERAISDIIYFATAVPNGG